MSTTEIQDLRKLIREALADDLLEGASISLADRIRRMLAQLPDIECVTPREKPHRSAR